MHMLLLSFASSLAADTQVGGAADFIAGIAVGEGGGALTLGLRQAEGDIKVGSDDFAFEAQVDVAATFSGDGILLYSIAPERLLIEGGGRGWKAWGGVFPGFFRLESVDPWRNQMVTGSLASALVPGAILGGGAEFGGPSAWVNVMVGALPATVDVFRLDDTSMGPMPFSAGARGRFDVQSVHFGGGAWFGGDIAALGFGGLELGGAIDLGVVSPYGELVTDLRDEHAGQLGADLFPDGAVSPGARVELDSHRGFGVAVGVASTLFEILRIKGEASYQAGNPGVYLEVAVFSKWPADDDRYGRPTATTRTANRKRPPG